MTTTFERKAECNAQGIPARPARKGKPASTHAGWTGGPRLLVVDDEILIAMQMAQFMENLGWSIIGPANSLEQADALLAHEGPPDAAILDIDIDGSPVFPLADALRSKGVSILFFTGYDIPCEMERFAGCSRLRKPVGVNQIYNEMNALMERRAAASA